MPATSKQRLARLKRTKADAVLVIFHMRTTQTIRMHGADLSALRRAAARYVRAYRGDVAAASFIPTRGIDGDLREWDRDNQRWRA
jgi:hypothetical protein